QLALQAFQRLELVADTYLSVGAPVQHALPKLLAIGRSVRDQILRRTAANLAKLRAALGERSACQVLEVEGGWCAVVRVPRVLTEEEWTLTLLEQDGVLVQPGFFFDFESEAYLVVSLLTHPETFREGIARLAAR
ncbi:MAG: pyridoxal phosphate-dependent aminotransferase, partial [Acidobacteriota bacterium]